ncbi:MAG: hypothetical protein L3J08_08870 [Flavobacteriaceae bacterium]|nr:hypothetical protein [Flavobacteriaceae bacterium]
MEKTLIIILLIFSSISNIVRAQETEGKFQKTKSIQISVGIGAKYDINNPNDYENKKPGFAFSFEIAKDFWNTGRHFIGIEMIGYNYIYEHSPIYKKKFLYWINLIYKRQSNIYNNVSFEVDLGFSLLGNDDEPSILGPILNIKIKYVLKNYELFIKNSFRRGFLFYTEKPWILTAGISIKI